MHSDDFSEWKPEILAARIREVEVELKELEKYYRDKKAVLVDRYEKLQLAISNRRNMKNEHNSETQRKTGEALE